MKLFHVSLFLAYVFVAFGLALAAAQMSAQAQASAADPKKEDKLPPPASLKIPMSPAKDACYAAVHKKDAADKAMSDLNTQMMTLQSQAQQKYQQLQAQQAEAQKEVDAADAALLKELKLDPATHVVNHDTMEAVAKPPEKPAPVARP